MAKDSQEILIPEVFPLLLQWQSTIPAALQDKLSSLQGLLRAVLSRADQTEDELARDLAHYKGALATERRDHYQQRVLLEAKETKYRSTLDQELHRVNAALAKEKDQHQRTQKRLDHCELALESAHRVRIRFTKLAHSFVAFKTIANSRLVLQTMLVWLSAC